MPDDSTTPDSATPPVDPYALARQISSDPAIPDEQKLSLLSEIGTGLGITGVVQINNVGMPTERALKAVEGFITRHGDRKEKMSGLIAEADEASALAASTRDNAGLELAEGMREIEARYQQSLAEVAQRLRGGSEGDRK